MQRVPFVSKVVQESCSVVSRLVESWPAILTGQAVLVRPTYSSNRTKEEHHPEEVVEKEKAARSGGFVKSWS